VEPARARVVSLCVARGGRRESIVGLCLFAVKPTTLVGSTFFRKGSKKGNYKPSKYPTCLSASYS